MARTFYAPLAGISVTNDSDQDIIEMVGASGYPFQLLRIELSSTYTAAEAVQLRLVRRSTTGSGGSALTEVKADAGGVANQTAVSVLVTTPGTIGDILFQEVWQQNGSKFIYVPTPDEVIEIASGGRLALNLQTAVGSTRTWSGMVVWKEFG